MTTVAAPTEKRRSRFWLTHRRRLAVCALVGPLALGGLGLGVSSVLAQDGDFAVGDEVVVNTDALNLREDAGLDGDVLAVLVDGTAAVVTDGPADADDYAWYELDVDGTSGWSAGDFLALAGNGGGGGGEFVVGVTLVLIDNDVNFRAEPDLSGDIMMTVDTGDLAVVRDEAVDADGYTWIAVSVDGEDGWMARDFLAFASSDGDDLEEGAVAAVNTDSLNLRDAAGLAGDVIATLLSGAEVTITGAPEDADGYAWYPVESDEGDGWVAGSFLLAT